MQAQGANSRVIIANELTLKSPPEYVIEACETAWTAVGSGVTCASTTTAARGSYAAEFSIVASLITASGLIGTKALAASLTLTNYTHLGVRIRPDASLASGALKILLDEHSLCASPLESLTVGALSANVWTFCKLTLANPGTDVSLISVGVRIGTPFDGKVIIDDIKAYNPAVVLPFVSEDVSLSQELLQSQVITSTRNEGEPILGNKAVDGPLSTEMNPYIQRVFHHMLGAMAVTGAGAPYTYKATIATLPEGLTYEKGFADVGKYFLNTGQKIASWKIGCSAGKINPLELTFMGAHAEVNAYSFDPSAVSYVHRPFTSFKATIKEGAGATQLATVTDFNVDGNNNTDGSSYVIDSTGERYDIPAGKIAVTGQLVALFTDTTLYDLALAGTTTKLVFEQWNGAGTGLTDGNEKVTLTLDEIKLKPKAPGITGPLGVKITLDFVAFYSSGSNASAIAIESLLPVNTVLY